MGKAATKKKAKGGATDETKNVAITEQQAKEIVIGLAGRAQTLDKLMATCISNDLQSAANQVDKRIKGVLTVKAEIEELFDVSEEEEAEDDEEGEEDEDDE